MLITNNLGEKKDQSSTLITIKKLRQRWGQRCKQYQQFVRGWQSGKFKIREWNVENVEWEGRRGGGRPEKQSLLLKAGKRDLAMFPTTLLVRPYWFTEDQNLTFFLGVILLKMAWTRHVLANIAPNARVKPMDMTQARALT